MPKRPAWLARLPGPLSGGGSTRSTTGRGTTGRSTTGRSTGRGRVAGSTAAGDARARGARTTSYAPAARPARRGQRPGDSNSAGPRRWWRGHGLRRVAWGAVAALGAVALVWGVGWLLQGDTLRVQHVTVIGAQIEGAHTITDRADLGGRSLLRLDTDAAVARVTALPGVRSATIDRDWPDGIVVHVTEHQGWGYWQAAGRRSVIDAEGLVLQHARPPRRTAPTVIEVAAEAVLEPGDHVDPDTVGLVDRMYRDGVFERLRVQPEQFEFRSDRGLTIRIAGGPDAVFGDSQSYDFKVAAWGSLLERIEQRYLEAQEIDLRFGQQLVLR